jgi:hypothetical protein
VDADDFFTRHTLIFCKGLMGDTGIIFLGVAFFNGSGFSL